MPEFHPDGSGVFIAGNAGDGGVASTNGQRVVLGPSAGNVHWYQGSECVCQYYRRRDIDAPPELWPALVAVDVNTGAERTLVGHGVNKIVAGAGHWFADKILDGQPVDFNVRAFAGDYMAWFPWNGTGLILRGPNGTDRTLSTVLGPEDQIKLFPDGSCAWPEAGQIKIYNWNTNTIVGVNVVPGGFGWIAPFRIGGLWWAAYQSYALACVVAHPATELVGYRWPAPNAFRLDATVVNTVPRLVWSTSSADAPQDIHLESVNLSVQRFDLTKPMPTHTARFWYGPNIGSKDMVQLFDDPAVLTGINVFGLVTENILNLGTAIGPNTFEALQANHAFQKLKQGGIALCIEGASLSDLEVVPKIRDVKGEVTFFSYSEPLTYAHGLPYAAVLDKVVIFHQEAALLGVGMGLLEAWPATDMATITRFIDDLVTRGAKPPYFHLDTDYNRATNEGKDTAAAIRQARATCDTHGILFGLFVNSTKDPIPTDAQHAANVKALAVKIHGLMPDLPQVHLAAWAQRVKGGPQDVPNNFGAYGLLQSFHDVTTIFGGITPDPEPEGLDMLSNFSDPLKEVIAVKTVKPVAGSKLSTWVLPNDAVYSCQPGGGYGERPAGTEGAWEKNRTNGNMGTFFVDGKYYTKCFCLVDGL